MVWLKNRALLASILGFAFFFGVIQSSLFAASGSTTDSSSTSTDTTESKSRCQSAAPTGAGAKYFGKICACIDARKNGTAKSLKDPICPEGKMSEEDVAYRVILDMEFADIDKKVTSDLKSFQKERGTDFTKMNDRIKNMFDTTAATPEYPSKYEKICRGFGEDNNPIRAGISAFWSLSSEVLAENTERCNSLTSKKLSAYKNMGKLIAMRNISKTHENFQQEYMTGLKDLYVNFFKKWDSYIAGLGAIKDKWNVKVKNPL